MNLKQRMSLALSIAFSVLLSVVMLAIYLLFSNYRTEEFHLRLQQSTEITMRALSALPIEDSGMKILSIDTEDPLFNEEIFVYNDSGELIFANRHAPAPAMDGRILEEVRRKNRQFFREGQWEIFARREVVAGQPLTILTKADDSWGREKLRYLRIILLFSYLISLASVWMLSYFVTNRMLLPLDIFQKKITQISAQNLDEKLPVSGSGDELNTLAEVFNRMLARIDSAYSSQKEFTSSASHELKTPLARIAYRLENLSELPLEAQVGSYVQSVREDVFQLSDTLESLLLLAKTEESQNLELSPIRIDEVIFDSFEIIKKNFPEFEMDFSLSSQNDDADFSVMGAKSLLMIVFNNLLKNAALYSEDKKAEVSVTESENIIIEISNSGELIPPGDGERIFQAFSRGGNSGRKPGSGLGLRISRRILDYHKAEISYRQQGGRNVFCIAFPGEPKV